METNRFATSIAPPSGGQVSRGNQPPVAASDFESSGVRWPRYSRGGPEGGVDAGLRSILGQTCSEQKQRWPVFSAFDKGGMEWTEGRDG